MGSAAEERDERARRIPAAAGLAPAAPAGTRPLGGAIRDTADEVRLADDGRYALKAAPTAPALRCGLERDHPPTS